MRTEQQLWVGVGQKKKIPAELNHPVYLKDMLTSEQKPGYMLC